MRTRRQTLRDFALLAATSFVRLPRAAPPPRPTRFIQVVLGGGFDALLATDPKTRAQLDSTIVLPYAEKDIVRAGTVSVAPALAPLGDLARRLTILNGVRCATASHDTGMARIQQLRMNELRGGRDFAAQLGERLHRHQPFEVVRLDGWNSEYFSAGAGRSVSVYASRDGWSLFDLLAQPNRIAAVAELPPAERALVAALPAKMPAPTPLGAAVPFPDFRAPGASWQAAAATWSVLVRDAIVTLEHNLAPVIVLVDPSEYDTHLYNLPAQSNALHLFAAAMAQLLARLDALGIVDVGILVSSEIGRFPVMNTWQGKDHLPELPFMFLGPGLRPGNYGMTDKRMLATPIKNRLPSIDDIATSVFEWFSVHDSLSSGYPGTRLDFLFA
jgi:hypothetical protein